MKKEQKQGTALAQEEQKEVRKEALEQKETQKGVWICGVEGRGEDVVKLLEKRGGRAHSITARQTPKTYCVLALLLVILSIAHTRVTVELFCALPFVR